MNSGESFCAVVPKVDSLGMELMKVKNYGMNHCEYCEYCEYNPNNIKKTREIRTYNSRILMINTPDWRPRGRYAAFAIAHKK